MTNIVTLFWGIAEEVNLRPTVEGLRRGKQTSSCCINIT